MTCYSYELGKKQAFKDIGLTKTSSEPEMGSALYSDISSATGKSGRLGLQSEQPSKYQVSTAFNEHDRHLKRDPADSENAVPVGSRQSKEAKVSQKELQKQLEEKSPVKIHRLPYKDELHNLAFYTRDGIDDKDLGINQKGPSIGLHKSMDNPYTLAHEIGHAQVDETTLGRIMQSPWSQYLSMAAPVATYSLGRLPLGAPRSKAKWILGTAGLMTAPEIGTEVAATLKGRQLIDEEHRGDYWKKILPYQATYLTTPAFAAAAGFLGAAHGLRKHGNYPLQGRINFRGLKISIENRKGSVRKWHDPHTGKEGKTVMKYPYGYIRLSEGMDGDHVDCFIGPDEHAKYVYVITTNKAPKFTEIDEQKCMLGFNTQKDAIRAFHRHYNDPRFFRNIKAIPFDQFKKKVLATKTAPTKKISSNLSKEELQSLIEKGPGPTDNKVPGDDLGLHTSNQDEYTKIVGEPKSPKDRIDSAFRYHDISMDTTSLE